MSRNRSEGWKHAKIDGHDNERDLGESLLAKPEMLRMLWSRAPKTQEGSAEFVISVDGAKHVDSILGGKTTSKVDLQISLGLQDLGCSIKKSVSGQVWLTSVDRFLRLLSIKGAKFLDDPDFEKGLRLFIGGEENLKAYKNTFDEGLRISEVMTPAIHTLELRHSRLSCGTIKELDRQTYETLLEGLRDAIDIITELAFATGAALEDVDRAELVVYNTPNELVTFDTEMLASTSVENRGLINPGPRNGGSTIWLPWGFLQMHRPQGKNLMQFHHKLERLMTHFDESCVVISAST